METFLKEKCFEQNPTVLDDDMPDFFEGWLERLDKGDLIQYIADYDSSLVEKQNK